MNTSFRRFEILLPLRFNDGSDVPDELDRRHNPRTARAIRCSLGETQTIHGVWTHDAEVYRDELIRVFVDAPDPHASRDFFVEFKERLKLRFDQLEIWMTTYPIEVL